MNVYSYVNVTKVFGILLPSPQSHFPLLLLLPFPSSEFGILLLHFSVPYFPLMFHFVLFETGCCCIALEPMILFTKLPKYLAG